MRTTLELEDDVYLHARSVAAAERVSVGSVVSRMMRSSLQQASGAPAAAGSGYVYKNGIPIIPADQRVITQELIDRIREQEGI